MIGLRLYVIRHGQSEGNRLGQYTGWADVTLTQQGVREAEQVGEIIKGISFDKIYSSDLIRAQQTAQAAIPGCVYETTELLREVNVGKVSGRPLASVSSQERQEMDCVGFEMYGGESRSAFCGRLRTFLRRVEQLGGENVAAFSHGGCLRAMLNEVVGCRLERSVVCCENCAMAVFAFEKGVWKLHSWINPM